MTGDEWRQQFDTRLTSIEERLSHVETNSAVDQAHYANIVRRLEKIENGNTWIIRLVLGSVVLALLGVILV